MSDICLFLQAWLVLQALPWMKLAPRLSDVGTLAYKACCERRASPTLSCLPVRLPVNTTTKCFRLSYLSCMIVLSRGTAGDMVVGTEMLSTLLATHPMPDAAR